MCIFGSRLGEVCPSLNVLLCPGFYNVLKISEKNSKQTTQTDSALSSDALELEFHEPSRAKLKIF